MLSPIDNDVSKFLTGKSTHTLMLFEQLIKNFEEIGEIRLEATKTMIGISNSHKRIAWITQLGKNFIHVVFPLREPHYDNFCFQKVAQVPGTNQFNHHLRVLQPEDINEEVLSFMKLAYQL
ncbi:DUF5655 domain-containing protein [Mucilaginibacter auburnensis]|uniref:DUF5655 domain-containing protein n=1 Tax=Mucilaginibacter auburnensis TaxID=1457233 RepID=A0A2H9VVW1_9SPHI|nr:DUF5655 domain-containing protein [Mucilaginibacter auburnensis]PJJ84958.1 hypothetical protein CLV57_1980 [Mucilaginibacter auburnensis]